MLMMTQQWQDNLIWDIDPGDNDLIGTFSLGLHLWKVKAPIHDGTFSVES